MIFDILAIVMNTLVGVYLIAGFALDLRTMKYQKKWKKEKAARIRIDPNISRAELCEQYVMFCKRNECKVDF